METADYTHEGSENARTALSGCGGFLSGGVGGVPADPVAAATREAEDNSIIVADDSTAPYGASETASEVLCNSSRTIMASLAFAEDLGLPPRTRDAEKITVGTAAAAAAAAAAAEAAPGRNSWQSPTTVTATPPARSVADKPPGPAPAPTCPDGSPGACWAPVFPFVPSYVFPSTGT